MLSPSPQQTGGQVRTGTTNEYQLTAEVKNITQALDLYSLEMTIRGFRALLPELVEFVLSPYLGAVPATELGTAWVNSPPLNRLAAAQHAHSAEGSWEAERPLSSSSARISKKAYLPSNESCAFIAILAQGGRQGSFRK